METAQSFKCKITNIDNVVCIKNIRYPKPYAYVGDESVMNNEKSKTLWLLLDLFATQSDIKHYQCFVLFLISIDAIIVESQDKCKECDIYQSLFIHWQSMWQYSC